MQGDIIIVLMVSEGDYNMNWGEVEFDIVKGDYQFNI